MIYAISNNQYPTLDANGELIAIRAEIEAKDAVAIAARIANGQVVQACDASRYVEGQRDRCYCCGDEVTPFHWQEPDLRYFKHLNNADFIGNHPANPARVHQPA
jgi:hypothetical protein